MVRTPACQAGGREFKSRRSRHNKIKGLEEILHPFLIDKILIPNTIPNSQHSFHLFLMFSCRRKHHKVNVAYAKEHIDIDITKLAQKGYEKK